ncbi:MAG: hypothetical protein HY391_06300 [Deltaproteobacteria bacterium]|nr:hypothetical protein [Deltaproteobacteria bacterium]
MKRVLKKILVLCIAVMQSLFSLPIDTFAQTDTAFCIHVGLKGSLYVQKEGEENAPLNQPGFGEGIPLGHRILVDEKKRAKILCQGDTLITLIEKTEVALLSAEVTATPYVSWLVRLHHGQVRIDRYGEDPKKSLSYLRLITPNALLRFSSGSGLFTYYPQTNITDALLFDGAAEIRSAEKLKQPAVQIKGGEISRVISKMSPSHSVKLEGTVRARFLKNSHAPTVVLPDPMFESLVLPAIKGAKR